MSFKNSSNVVCVFEQSTLACKHILKIECGCKIDDHEFIRKKKINVTSKFELRQQFSCAIGFGSTSHAFTFNAYNYDDTCMATKGRLEK